MHCGGGCFISRILSLNYMIHLSLPALAFFMQGVAQEPGWDSLEITKLLVSVLMPVSVVVFGWLLNRRLKHIEHRQWANQKLIEKRLELYDELAPGLNKLLCFYNFVGSWKDISPKEALETKRALDQKVHIYRYLLGEKFFSAYIRFIELLFKQWQGYGKSASFKSNIATTLGSRMDDSHYEWDSEWDSWFVEEGAPSFVEVERGYTKVMRALSDTIELYDEPS